MHRSIAFSARQPRCAAGSGTGGSADVFSGFDLDFAFLGLDGNFAIPGDRVFASVFNFTTETIRATANPDLLPTAGRPGPTSGSSAANAIDAGFNTDNVSGWLTLGDGGSLKLGFASLVTLTGSEALFLGEVGTSAGELTDGASVNVSSNPIPEPGSLALACVGLAGIGCMRRKAKSV